MSLRWRIMGAIVFVVVLTVLASVGVGYYATQTRLGVFVEQVGGDEARQLARNLGREYTAAGGWATRGPGAVSGRIHLRWSSAAGGSRRGRGRGLRVISPGPGASRHR